MVWGMRIPESFGEFWPDGDFESTRLGDNAWRERLKAYYMEQAPTTRKALFDYAEYSDDAVGKAAHFYAGYAIAKFVDEVGTRPRLNAHSPPLQPIEAHEPPRFFTTEKSYSSLGSLIALNCGILAGDEALKNLIERLEPSVHQFFPIEIRMPRGTTFLRTYYTFVISRYFDGVSLEHSKPGSCREREPGFYFYDCSKKGINGIAMRKEAFGSAHLWQQRGFPEPFICISDELQAEAEQAGLRLPKHYKMIEA